MKWIHNGYKTLEEVIEAHSGVPVSEFLTRKYYAFDDMNIAANMIRDAVNANEKITVFGDYDADGVTSSSILDFILKELKANYTIRLPKRLSEGYGLSEKFVEDELEPGLLITVDNGIAALSAVKKAKDKGLKVLILDHHLAVESGEVPEADFVVDPHIIKTADYEDYCGAGLAYKLACTMFPNNKVLLDKLSCLAAIGTIADVMPLTGDNRNIVLDGLENMKKKGHRPIGLAALLDICCLGDSLTAKDIAFKIGPMINAPGRLFDDGANIPLKLLTFNGNYTKAVDMATELESLNNQRKEETKVATELIHKNISDNCLYGDVPLCIYEPGLNPGLVGILAGRIAEEMRVPTFIFTDAEGGLLKGSGRNGGTINLKELLDAHCELFAHYGGHEGAAGVAVEKDKYQHMVDELLKADIQLPDEVSDICYDLEVSINEVPALLKEMEKYEPYGMGNEKPVLLIKDFRSVPKYGKPFTTMGEDKQTIKIYGTEFDAIGFGMYEDYKRINKPREMQLIGTLGKNNFMGKEAIQLELIDFKSNEKVVTKGNLQSLLANAAASRY